MSNKLKPPSAGYVFDVHSGAKIPCNVLNAVSATDVAKAVLLEPYDGVNEKYKGRTKMEVMFMRLANEATSHSSTANDAARTLLDRCFGKPKQSVETVNVTASLDEFLTALNPANPMQPAPQDELVDIEIVEVDDEEERLI